MENSVEFNIELNAKDNFGETAFHYACEFGRKSIVELMIINSDSLNLDLTATDNQGRTGFKLAQVRENHEVVSLILSKMPNIAFWFLVWNKYFHFNKIIVYKQLDRFIYLLSRLQTIFARVIIFLSGKNSRSIEVKTSSDLQHLWILWISKVSKFWKMISFLGW